MRWTTAFPLLASATSVLATLNWNQLHPEYSRRQTLTQTFGPAEEHLVEKRQKQQLFLNDRTTKFAVNGSGLPEVGFDVGESYAGSLPINNNDPSNQLFFWFFPSTNPVAQEKKEILIWLTGGPGCSSVGELLQENGPVLWVPGVFKPVANKWSWHHLTNVVWVDQPVGSGFSTGTPTARDEADVAQQFLGFWKNFVDTFTLQGYKVYVTGSSYSGMYTPYISSAMLDQNDPTYFNVTGMMVFDGLYSKDPIARDIPVATFVDQWADILSFNDTFAQSLRNAAAQCGYTDYLQKYLAFPPFGVQPSVLPGQQAGSETLRPECDIFFQVYAAALELNPCFSVYEIAARCPLVFDPLGFSAGTNYLPDGAGPVYFDRADVKRAIHAPANHTWEFCASQPVFVNNTDLSQLSGPGSQPVIPKVIERTQNVLLGHGSRDFVLIADGTLLTIQNLTWGGKLGFQAQPTSPLYIPYHVNNDFENIAGAGVVGTSHSERGLTYFGVGTGHFLTQDQPAVAFRGVEILLGRVPNFQSTVPFTTEVNATAQPNVALGNGTFAVGFQDPRSAVQGAGSSRVGGAQSVTSVVGISGADARVGNVRVAAAAMGMLAIGFAVLM